MFLCLAAESGIAFAATASLPEEVAINDTDLGQLLILLFSETPDLNR